MADPTLTCTNLFFFLLVFKIFIKCNRYETLESYLPQSITQIDLQLKNSIKRLYCLSCEFNFFFSEKLLQMFSHLKLDTLNFCFWGVGRTMYLLLTNFRDTIRFIKWQTWLWTQILSSLISANSKESWNLEIFVLYISNAET